MARFALHPKTNEKISIEDWELYHKEETPICIICGHNLYVRANSSPGSSAHFAHYPGSNCPSIQYNREKYDSLQPVEKDYQNAKKLKKHLINNMWPVYQKCKSIFGQGFRQKDFQKMILKASERNIWFYKGMTLKYLPYVLLVNYGVFQKEDHRKNKVYFVFDSKLSNYEDLWIKPKIKQKMWKVYPEEGQIEEVEIDFDTSSLSPEYFLFWATGLQGKKENEFLDW
ncbi:hypothetical protein MOF05_07740 [Bacillus haynesii]|uniref:hypothetical protein n=1 Tax=Bacillus TaxID=1386 RepID=UPI0022822719|nr:MULTISPECIES: hypothetical protein [Bacillus]MCY7773449.1 hypothetical protein [Bacillus licheniformis]MCY7780160.1 hypothetical protein [Bacillus haynesii]MCY8021527.1 hypothetical protein [Bacillus licheniformis]MCY8530069.1 hypothetical protein [Bacillus licheniformis]MCY9266920.1 hypothetical protein [Bacillus licheniformis]